MHMSVDRYYCYVYQNAENEDMTDFLILIL